MRHFGDSESKYLKGNDLKKPDGSYAVVPCVIDRVAVEEFDTENHYVLYFQGKQKGLLLNKTNEAMLVSLFGLPGQSNDPQALSQHFHGNRIVLAFDQNVMYAGKRVGGLRLHPSQAPVSEVAPTPPPPADDPPPHTDEDEIPF